MGIIIIINLYILLVLIYSLLAIPYWYMPIGPCRLPTACDLPHKGMASRTSVVFAWSSSSMASSCRFKIMCFSGKTTYSNREFDMIDPNKLFI